jgi:predicted dehydrogenase
MLERERPAIVSICVPTAQHSGVFHDVCASGAAAVFLEKPVAACSAEARKFPVAAAGRPVAVNYFRRWNPAMGALKEEIARGDFGKPIRTTIYYVKGLVGNASHYVDLVRWLFGEPLRVRALRGFAYPDQEESADFEMEFPSGMLATFLHIPPPGYVFLEVDILLERSRVVIGQRGQRIFRHPVIDEPHYGMFRIVASEGSGEETGWRNCTLRAVEELVSCVERGGQPACTLDDGLRALAICEDVLGAWQKDKQIHMESVPK